MFKKIIVPTLIVLVAIVGVLGVVVAMQPSEFRIERSATISAPASEIFTQVNDLHKWPRWSAWENVDPNMQRTYDGASAGKGAIYSWVGNNDVGEGRMTIIESRPNELVRIKLDFFKPMEGTSTAEFTFKPQQDGTEVTWAMFGPKNFAAKAVHLCMDMDNMIGDQFAKGLANLKAIVEPKGDEPKTTETKAE